MIECANCETAQYLNITYSRLHFDEDDQADTIDEVAEAIECTWCGATGGYQSTPASGRHRCGRDAESTKNPTECSLGSERPNRPSIRPHPTKSMIRTTTTLPSFASAQTLEQPIAKITVRGETR